MSEPSYDVPEDQRLDYDRPDQTMDMVAADHEFIEAARKQGGGIVQVPEHEEKPVIT